MVLPRPGAALRIDGRQLGMPEAAAVAVAAESTVTGTHDRAGIVLGPLSPWLEASAGAVAELSLGVGDDLEPVLTGRVVRVRQLPWGTLLDVLAATAALDRLRVGRVYTAQTAGDIVRDLCSSADLTPGEVDAGPTLSAYHIDERRTGWRHLRDLARLMGSELASGAGGEVHVRAPRTGRAQHRLRAGAELLAWSAGTKTPGPEPLQVGPYGAASEQGADAWSLVAHQPGGSGPHRVLPGIRDREGASSIDRAASAAHARSDGWARALATGSPAIRAGDLVELADVPRASGTYRVLRARHRLDGSGLRTSIEMEAAA